MTDPVKIPTMSWHCIAPDSWRRSTFAMDVPGGVIVRIDTPLHNEAEPPPSTSVFVPGATVAHRWDFDGEHWHERVGLVSRTEICSSWSIEDWVKKTDGDETARSILQKWVIIDEELPSLDRFE